MGEPNLQADEAFGLGERAILGLMKRVEELTAELKEVNEQLRERSAAPIVCLCGSTRFMETFFAVGWELTLREIVVLSIGVCKHAEHHGAEALGKGVAARLDELHKRKIDIADAVFVLNVGGYIGESTRGEIEYAIAAGKLVADLDSFRPIDWDQIAELIKKAAASRYWSIEENGPHEGTRTF